MELSLVTDCGSTTHECGYCKKENSWTNHGIWAFNLRNADYLELLHRGWRRSGHYIYRPSLEKNCCCSYTIRLDTTQFKATRSQKRARRIFDRFLDGTWVPTEHRLTAGGKHEVTEEELQAAGLSRESHYPHPASALQAEQEGKDDAMEIHSSQKTAQEHADEPSTADNPQPNPPAPRPVSPMHKKVKSDLESPELKPEQPLKGVKHTLDVKIVPAQFRAEAFEVYKKYQSTVHHDKLEDLSEKNYTRFLCDSPLFKNEKQGDVPLGSFHIEYRIDDKLMMVDVVDILPACLSSVYLFYDPAYSFLSPGVVSALFEIERVKALKDASLKYLYLGYYIHSCAKMRYKAQFRPSELMCPETRLWFPYEQVQSKLDQSSYNRFASPRLPGQPIDDDSKRDYSDRIGTTPVAFKRTLMAFSQLPAAKRNDLSLRQQLNDYWKLAGPEAASRMVLVMQ